MPFGENACIREIFLQFELSYCSQSVTNQQYILDEMPLNRNTCKQGDVLTGR